MADWLHENGAVLTLSVHVQPAAKRSEIVGLHGDALKVRLAAPAIDGRASAALIEFFAQRLGLAKSLIELKSGHQSRRKRLTLSGVSASSLRRLLGQ